MNETKLQEALAQSSFLSTSGLDFSRSFNGGAVFKRLPAGSILFREGERSDSFFLVHSGHIALDMKWPGRESTRLLTVGPDEILAWSALVGDGRMTTSATALDDAEVIEFSGPELMRQCEMEPEFGYRLMRRLAESLAKRLLATRLQMLDLFSLEDGGNDRGAI